MRYEINRIQSKDHNIQTYEINKVSISCYNNEKYIHKKGCHTPSHFHKSSC